MSMEKQGIVNRVQGMVKKMHSTSRVHYNSQPKTYNLRAQRGFTLLLAALVASIVLSVGAAIFGIAQKQLTLSALGRDSQFAFYAADTAAECALYWDFRCNYFASSTAGINAACNNPTPTCDGQAMGPFNPDRPGIPAYPYTMTSRQMDLFSDVSTASGFCVEVSVKKCQGTFTEDGNCTTGLPTDAVRTIIHADGYSTNCAAILTSERALQRSVELHY